MTNTGAQYVAALAAKDTESLLGIFAEQVSFQGMTPMWIGTARSPTQVVHGVLYEWFGPDDVIEAVERVEARTVVDRERLDYRFRVRNADGVFCVEQCAYFDLDDDGLVSRMHVMCSGYRPIADAPTP